jgi:hypothetical protein
MDDNRYLSLQETNTASQFFIKDGINKADLNKMVTGTQRA